MLVEQGRMDIAYVNGQTRALATGTLLLLTLSLGGCATSTADSTVVDARAEAPSSRKTSGYPSLEVLPPSEVITADKRLKLEKELTAARDRAVKAKREAPPTVQSTNQADRQ
jgi:hypothetical protein